MEYRIPYMRLVKLGQIVNNLVMHLQILLLKNYFVHRLECSQAIFFEFSYGIRLIASGLSRKRQRVEVIEKNIPNEVIEEYETKMLKFSSIACSRMKRFASM